MDREREILLNGELGDEAGKRWQSYQNWFERLDPTDQFIDITVTVRVRLYGSQTQKQAEWERDWRSINPHWGPVPAGMSVSSLPPEIWGDLRRVADGRLVVPQHVVGHEMAHTLWQRDRRVLVPDLLIDNSIY